MDFETTMLGRREVGNRATGWVYDGLWLMFLSS
jgi:hypothetical protein